MGGVRFTEEWVREYRKKREAESRNSAEAGAAPHQSRYASQLPPGEAIRDVTAESLGNGGGGTPHQTLRSAKPASNYGIAATGSYGRSDSLRDAPPPGEALRGAKYGNEKVCRGGKRFDSKHEAAVYEELRLRCMAGEYLGLGLQVAFYLPGGIKYLADFVAITKEGGIVVMDAKSEATRRDKVYRLKKRLMKECLGLEIREV